MKKNINKKKEKKKIRRYEVLYIKQLKQINLERFLGRPGIEPIAISEVIGVLQITH